MQIAYLSQLSALVSVGVIVGAISVIAKL
jgi:hypothetical protein